MDKIIFPNGNEKIISIDFPDHTNIFDSDLLECSSCKKRFIAGVLFDLHLEWSKQGCIYNPQGVADFLHRECPYCNTICRILKLDSDAIGCTGGGFMPNASETMKLYISGEEIVEMSKGGEVTGIIKGPGEIVEFDSKTKKNADGTPAKEKKIQICVDLGAGEERFWTPNATTMRSLIAKFGQATEDWEGQKIKLEAVKQNVSGNMKQVVYGSPTE